MSKIVQLKLSFPHWSNRDKGVSKYYRVIQVTNSVEFEPNQDLSKKEVDDLCASEKYNVTIVSKKE